MPDALNYSKLFDSKVVDHTAEDEIFSLDSGVLRNLVVLISNTTGGTLTVDGWVIPSEGSADTTNRFLSGYSIAGNSSAEVAVPKMVAGDNLTLRASATGLTIFDHDGVSRT